MRPHRSLTISLVCLALLSLLLGAGAAGAHHPALPSPAPQPLPEAAPVLAGPAREGCLPQQGSWVIERPDWPREFGPQGSRTLALDTAGRPHIVYGGTQLYYAWHDGTAWHREVVDQVLGTGAYASLALDQADYPHISYYDDLLDIFKYAYFDGAQWEIHVFDPYLGDT